MEKDRETEPKLRRAVALATELTGLVPALADDEEEEEAFLEDRED